MLKNKTEFDKNKTKASISFLINDNLNNWYKQTMKVITIIEIKKTPPIV